ncbi:MAG TPA: hypothetical protein VK483_08900 [Chitinophagaceae bacterium]|nr:hypothetical protein [Chitinophagaceae bacterium]
MQFEELDDKIKEAAENHHPAYDENAWAKMEDLLNKHLPQENDRRRRFILFIFLFLLLGAGSLWLFNNKPWKGSKQVTSANTTIPKPAGEPTAPVSANEKRPGDDNDRLNKEEVADIRIPGNDKTITTPTPADQNASLLNAVNKKDRPFIISSTNGITKKKQKNEGPFPGFNKDQDLADKNVNKERLNDGQFDPSTTKTIAATLVPGQNNNKKDVVADKDVATNTKPVEKDPSAKENTNKDNTLVVQNSPDKKTKDKSKKRNTFFFTLSAGPDISATGGDQLGKTRLLAGAGLGYTFNDRLTIRSGFYSGRKIYTSSPGSYHPPASFWNYYRYLEKVEADCRVYEIPLSLSYNFGHSSKQNWFASAGISSYLMKKETYDYYYKYTPGGPTYQKELTVQNENNHYFSVLTFSGGYQRNIGRSFSVMVEPYFKLPLSGVGFGKVKLNSGGVLVTAVIKPFAGSGNQK